MLPALACLYEACAASQCDDYQVHAVIQGVVLPVLKCCMQTCGHQWVS